MDEVFWRFIHFFSGFFPAGQELFLASMAFFCAQYLYIIQKFTIFAPII